MSQLSITLSHGEYSDLDRALKVTHEEYKTVFHTRDARVVAVIQARQSIGMSMEPRHLFSDYSDERDAPTLHNLSTV